MRRTLAITIAIAVMMLSGCTKQAELNPPEPLSAAEVVAKVNPSVVQIVTMDGTGSGIILDTDGHVLTNNHVIEKAASANVVLSDGRTLSAKVVNRDWTIDLAVLKVTASNLQPATLARSSDVRLGEDVMTLGYPLDLGSSVTVTKGIVSAFRQPYVQTDAPVNPGNSGGPLVNMWGEVIGVVTAKPSTQGQQPSEGIGFAIAIDKVKDTLTVLLSPQKLSSLGAYVSVTDLPEAEAGLFAVDSLGNVHFVWNTPRQYLERPGITPKLMYSVKTKQGTWSTPDMIAQGFPYDPQEIAAPWLHVKDIAVDQDGTAHLVWIQNTVFRVPIDGLPGCFSGHLGDQLFYASKSPGQAWSSPTCLSNEPSIEVASLALDSSGTVHLVYAERGPASYSIAPPEPGVSYMYKPKEATWSQPSQIQGTIQSETTWTKSPTLSADGQGNLHLVFYYQDQTATWTGPMYTCKSVGATWTVPAPILQTPELRSPQLIQLVFDSAHNGFLACEDADGRIAYSSLLPDQSLSPIQYLSGADHRCTDVRLGRSASGTIYAAWTRNANPEDTNGSSLILRWRNSDDSWSPQYVVREGVALGAFAVDGAGDVHFSMYEYQSGQTTAYRYLTLALSQVIT